MARNFPNWLTAYCAYADDGFTPEQFNKWVGLSTIAGALERKCWLPWSIDYEYYPNIYVILISKPGVGKSTSLNKASELLREVAAAKQSINFIPAKITEAAFINRMSKDSTFFVGNAIHKQCAGYYQASEASSSLKDIFGGFIDCLTEFYDCGKEVKKQTQKDGEVSLTNVCVNLIACSTFAYLAELVDDTNIMGGFASRLIYVVQKEQKLRTQRFQAGLGKDKQELAQRNHYRQALISDLAEIHKLSGAFHADASFAAAWEKWSPEEQIRRFRIKSEKLQSLLARTNTNVFKVAMLLSAAESSDMIIHDRHFLEAVELVEACNETIPEIFRSSKALNTKTQSGLNSAMAGLFAETKAMPMKDLRMQLVKAGFSPQMTENALKVYLSSELLRECGDGKFEFLGNANDYL